MTRVAVLGLGMMGTAIAMNLLNQKLEVHVYNRTGSKAKLLAAHGAIVHPTPFKAVRSDVDITITIVTDHNAVCEIALGKRFLGWYEEGQHMD